MRFLLGDTGCSSVPMRIAPTPRRSRSRLGAWIRCVCRRCSFSVSVKVQPTLSSEVGTHLRDEGWAVTPPLVAPPIMDALATELAPCLDGESARGGVRNLLEFPSVQSLARSDPVRAVAEAALGKECFAVRGILFDKTAGANWKVVWHQDLTIAVKEQRDIEGFGPWSEKGGVPHVQAPDSILEKMVAVRVHLDDCGPDNGPVRVIPRSHTSGRLSPLKVEAWKAEHPVVECLVDRGGILAFFPLVLHASSPAMRPRHRRVVHLEFAARSLPEGLEWYNTVDV